MKITKWNGKPITKPGWYSGIPIETYHSAGICDGPAVSSTNLRKCWAKSPAHMCHEWCEDPNHVKPKATHAKLLGGCAHFLLLGEDNFRLKYIAQPDTYRDKVTAEEKPWNNNAGVCKKWNGEQREAGRTVVLKRDLDAIVAISRSLASDPLVQTGLLRGAVECSGFAKDRETGLWLKIRPDVVPQSGADYIDLKTASEVTTPALQYSIRTYGYHQQGALVWEVCELLGAPFESFVLLFTETDAPYCARSAQLPADDLARGRLQNRAMMRQIAGCIANSHWPGPGEGDPRDLPLATDERTRIDNRLKFEGLA